jgi:hypothetical protein
MIALLAFSDRATLLSHQLVGAVVVPKVALEVLFKVGE